MFIEVKNVNARRISININDIQEVGETDNADECFVSTPNDVISVSMTYDQFMQALKQFKSHWTATTNK